MRTRRIIPWLLLLAAAGAADPARAEGRAHGWRLGAAMGYERQQLGTLGNRAYEHEGAVVKLVAARPLLSAGRATLELSLEPFLAAVHHRLRNPWFVQPSAGADYLAQRARFTAGESYREYGVDVGLSARWAATPRLDLLAMGSIGPMYGDAATERLARGLAFSDIAALGAAWRQGGLAVELRAGFRHVSNGYLQLPNAGHNAGFVLLAITRELDR